MSVSVELLGKIGVHMQEPLLLLLLQRRAQARAALGLILGLTLGLILGLRVLVVVMV